MLRDKKERVISDLILTSQCINEETLKLPEDISFGLWLLMNHQTTILLIVDLANNNKQMCYTFIRDLVSSKVELGPEVELSILK